LRGYAHLRSKHPPIKNKIGRQIDHTSADSAAKRSIDQAGKTVILECDQFTRMLPLNRLIGCPRLRPT